MFGYRNLHLNEIKATVENERTRQVCRDPGREMDVFAIHISAAFCEDLTRLSESTGNTYNFRIFYRAGQKPVRRRALRYCDLDTGTVNFIRSF